MCLEAGNILHGRHGNYRIIEQLGQGGFGRTYKAAQLRRTRKPLCVVKEIPFPQSNDPQVLEKARERFQREASALEILGHLPCVPKLFDSLEENHNFYLVQEYIQGNLLKEELTPGQQWREEDAIALLREILEILQPVHEQGIIHRDITPSNLIRRKKNKKLILIDFGAVKEISTLSTDSTGEFTSRAVCTEGYAPPEQYNCNFKPRPYNDIYAVGTIVIEALTGKYPKRLPRDHDGEIIWIYSTQTHYAPKVSKGLENILNKMVRWNFNERYQSVDEVLADLEEIEQPPTNIWWQLLSRFRRSVLSTAGIAATGAIVLLVSRIPSLIPITSTQPTPIEPSPISPPLAQPALSADGISSGEKLLVQISAPWSKQRAIGDFARSNYPEALKLFKQLWKQDRRDPETLIYMNNALLEAIGAEYYTIAIVVPIRRKQDGSINTDLAEELLRGVAQAQTEVNLSLISNDNSNKDFPGRDFLQAKRLKNKGMKVIIADDSNIKTEGVKRANSLVQNPEILAVIGHYTSDMTVETVDIYDRHKLVAISPGSTTEELTRVPRKFFFRTAPTTSKEAEGLVDRLLSVGQKKVAVFYNPGSPFSYSLWEEFTKQFEAKGGQTVRLRNHDNLAKNDFNAQAAIEEVEKAGIKAIAVFPDGQVTNSVENALEMIKINADRNWIVGPWTLYEPRTLKIAKSLRSVDKLAISLFWHPSVSFDKQFPVNAEKLWGGPVNTRSALTYDATKTLIEALEMQAQPTREGMQKTLASGNFKAEGATGIIEFDSQTGNRKNPPSRVAHIVPCPTAIYGVTFVPIEFPTAAAAGLKCE